MGVGHLLGKLFGGEGAKNEAVLRAYGKLPFYAEYRRLEVSPGAPTAYSQWLDEGRLAWARSPSHSERGSVLPSRLLIGMPGTKDVVVANVWDSRDSLGRVFPFSFFVTCPLEALGSDPVERLITVSSLHTQFERLHGQLLTLASGGDFYRRFNKHMVMLKPEDLADRARALREEAARIAAESWLRGLSTTKETTTEEWFGNLLRRVERWRGHSTETNNLAISCPIVAELSASAQIVLWFEWLDGMIRRTGRSPWILMSMEAERRRGDLNLLLREPLPDDFQLMTTDADAYGFVEHLALLSSNASGPQPSANVQPTDSVLTWLKQHAP